MPALSRFQRLQLAAISSPSRGLLTLSRSSTQSCSAAAAGSSALRLQNQLQTFKPSPFTRRYNSSTSSDVTSSPTIKPAESKIPPPPPTRWITELRDRIGKCIIFGCNKEQITRADAVLKALSTEWKELLAGSDGFLSGGRGGLDNHRIAWGEMDTFGHVNNVNYYRYAESARVNWINNFAVHIDPANKNNWENLMKPHAIGLIMRSLKCDFKFPMVYPDKISVYHKLRLNPADEATPPSAFRLDCIVVSNQHRRVAAKLDEDIVVYDYRKAAKTGMPEFVVKQFAETFRLQQEEMARARTRIWELVKEVEVLENETWNCPDAVEDIGPTGSSG